MCTKIVMVNVFYFGVFGKEERKRLVVSHEKLVGKHKRSAKFKKHLSLVDEVKELLAGLWIVTEDAEHA